MLITENMYVLFIKTKNESTNYFYKAVRNENLMF